MSYRSETLATLAPLVESLKAEWLGRHNVIDIHVSIGVQGDGWRGRTPVINFVVTAKDPNAEYPQQVGNPPVVTLVHVQPNPERTL